MNTCGLAQSRQTVQRPAKVSSAAGKIIMRRFNAQEIAWLECLVSVARIGPIPAPAFLARLHFSRAQARALILQPRARFGYCYVRPARFAQPGAEQDERRSLMTLLLLLAWLRRENYLAVEHDGSSGPPSLVVVGDAFDAVRPERTRVVLNADGQYSSDPQQVLDASAGVAYQGLRLEGDAFALAYEWARGTLHASIALEELLSRARLPALQVPAQPAAEILAATVPSTAAQRHGRKHGRWTLIRILERAVVVSEGTSAVAGLAHAALHTHLIVWLLGMLSASIAGLHLAGLLGAYPAAGSSARRVTPVAAHIAPLAEKIARSSNWTLRPVQALTTTAHPARDGAVAAATVASTPWAVPAAPLRGLDVSKWNGNWMDHLHGALSGISFAFARASDGLQADPDFDRNWDAMHHSGLVRGSYHFYRVAVDPEDQAHLYLRMLGGSAQAGDIAPVLDFEEGSFDPGKRPPRRQVQDAFLRALRALEQQGGRVPMIYTNWDAGMNWLDDSRFSRYPLWIADWSGHLSPRLPSPWAEHGFRFWQRTDHYRPPDASGPAFDLDWFVGSRADLVR